MSTPKRVSKQPQRVRMTIWMDSHLALRARCLVARGRVPGYTRLTLAGVIAEGVEREIKRLETLRGAAVRIIPGRQYKLPLGRPKKVDNA